MRKNHQCRKMRSNLRPPPDFWSPSKSAAPLRWQTSAQNATPSRNATSRRNPPPRVLRLLPNTAAKMPSAWPRPDAFQASASAASLSPPSARESATAARSSAGVFLLLPSLNHPPPPGTTTVRGRGRGRRRRREVERRRRTGFGGNAIGLGFAPRRRRRPPWAAPRLQLMAVETVSATERRGGPRSWSWSIVLVRARGDGWVERGQGWNHLGIFSGGQCGRSNRAEGVREEEDAFKFASIRTREFYREQFRFCKIRGFFLIFKRGYKNLHGCIWH
uniref:Uncharacterized protein n=1 Tax=Setaria viridis TaxID=4556 RepID=A0A4U6W2M3_SETVI|nr:hypothetical protein SEVIR_2G382701v2 [Setaria viridis]